MAMSIMGTWLAAGHRPTGKALILNRLGQILWITINLCSFVYIKVQQCHGIQQHKPDLHGMGWVGGGES